MIPADLVEVNQTWPEPGQKARALGLWSAASAVATALGPAVGGFLVSGLSWQSVFWINVPLGLFALWGLRLGASQREPQRRLPAPDASSPLSVRAFIGSVAGAAIMTAGANGTVQVVTIHLQTTVALPPGQTGLVLLLATAPFVILGPLSGNLVNRSGRRRVAAVGFTFGAVCLTTLGRLANITGLIPSLLGIGIALALMTSAIVGESLDAWPRKPGLASGVNNAAPQAGTGLGVAIAAYLANRYLSDALLQLTGIASSIWCLLGAAVVAMTFKKS